MKKNKTAWDPHDLAWSPNGEVLAFIGRTGQRSFSYEVYLIDAEGQAVKQLTDDQENTPGGEKCTLAWSADGAKLIYGTCRLPGQKVWVIEICILADSANSTEEITLSPLPTHTQSMQPHYRLFK